MNRAIRIALVTALPLPLVAQIVNAASYRYFVAPGSLASIFGYFPCVSTASATQTPLPLSLNGVSFLSSSGNGPRTPVPLYFVSSGQANIQVPWKLEGVPPPASAWQLPSAQFEA